ncbi:MAG: YbaN family protein, partial [Candidatus Thiodiazotropha sp.]
MSMTQSDPLGDKPQRRASRPWLLAGGWLLFGLGVIGIALPVMPTTVFWIGAVWCWSRSAPQLTRRILSHPRFGQPVYLFIEYGVMTRLGKWAAISGIAFGYLLLQLLGRPDWPVSLVLGLTLALIAVWLWQHPEPAMEPIVQTTGPPPAGNTD